MNSSADIFIEDGSKVNVADGATMTFQEGASLELKNGATFTMGTDTSVKMSGEMEMDLSRLVFTDSRTGRKYRIWFRDAHECEGRGIVMDYAEVTENTPSTREVVKETT